MAHQSQLVTLTFLLLLSTSAWAEPIVYPYLQNVQLRSAELYWVDTDPKAVQVSWASGATKSVSREAPELDYHPVEKSEFPLLTEAVPRYLHKATLRELEPGETVAYTVHFSGKPFRSKFTSLSHRQRVRLIAYADSETEPESTGKHAKWGTPSEPQRRYLVDQTTGYRANLKAIAERQPTAILIAGDLVESGGEQRDWDEFWNHKKSIAGSIPLLTAPGNHEYYAGPRHGKYSKTGSPWAIAKYDCYFHPQGEMKASHYYRQDFGPVTLLSLDSGDGRPHGSAQDTNHYLQAAGSLASDFNTGSNQYRWLKRHLSEAQSAGQLILVMFHHCPYSSGTHGFPAGNGDDEDPQSGQAMRVLTPLLMRYGVDIVITGHDEMFEHSILKGKKITSKGNKSHTLHVYDVGVGGDGLRGPKRKNRHKRFLAYDDSPEVWDNDQLLSGGRHYGHLEIDVVPVGRSDWKATVKSVYLLPTKRRTGWSFKRHAYPDSLELTSY